MNNDTEVDSYTEVDQHVVTNLPNDYVEATPESPANSVATGAGGDVESLRPWRNTGDVHAKVPRQPTRPFHQILGASELGEKDAPKNTEYFDFYTYMP